MDLLDGQVGLTGGRYMVKGVALAVGVGCTATLSLLAVSNMLSVQLAVLVSVVIGLTLIVLATERRA